LAAVLRHERLLSDELSHELRTPLARIQAEVDLLHERPREPAEQARALDAVDDAAGSMRDILETLMATARSANGAAPGRCAVGEVMVPLLRRTAGARPELRTAVDVPSNLMVGVDAAVLERMTAPLVENAVRYAEGQIRVAASRRGAVVRLVVGDDGPGIPEDHRERVFEPGWRGNPEDEHDGAGLGLALARRLATAAGAQISVLPAMRGCWFAVDLPGG
jgi:signal transduction histidine kinase